MRVLPVVAAVLGLAACSPQVPESGGGVGFTDYNSYVRNAQPAPAVPLAPMSAQPAPVTMPPATGFSPAGASAAIDRATGVTSTDPAAFPAAPAPMASTLAPAPMDTVPLDANGQRPRGNAPEGIKEESGEMTHAGISDENDFQAVSARETIASDKERIERNKAQYTVDQPTALPSRPGDAGASPAIQFALSTSHPVGTQMYDRAGLKLKSPDAACLKYSSDIEAQEDFLAAGGPERDRRGIDPDGDGYACGWDPAPFRAALQ
ncbi:hypothetical protein G4Z14_11440 [Rhodobacteraceae bacterium KMS-5]|uniref:Excalibur calcium-binding domain-containing protein n=2 Tax=Tabrizicola oligotrophica TaxID=2710650 RepID=A0A6M0QWN5_9RHOB|nr:hypothetical protein [Tabrizicola oligotrophica]